MRRRPRRSMLQRSKSGTSLYQNCNSYKWFLLIFICVWFSIATYFLYHPAIPFATQQKKSMFCKQLMNESDNIIIQNICSFVHYLDIDLWINKDCYFKHPVEGHWAIGGIMTIWYKLTKNQHCSTINIHEFLTDSNRINNDEKKEKENEFTILINSWQRNDCLIQSVEHYLSCNDVAQIRIIWSDPDNDIPHHLKILKTKLVDSNRLIFDEYKDNKLTNRFKYNEEWITNGIFQTDDDIMFSCDMISNTFKLWRLIPNYMIGFAPREPGNNYYKITNKIDRNKQFYEWDNSFTNCQYSLLFQTLGGFMHKKYYKLYDENDINGIKNGWKQIKDSVNGNITAEDISMTLLYSYKSRYPPITVIVPESEMFINDFLKCQKHKSFIMHSHSAEKRTNIFLDIINIFQFQQPLTSSLWLDVMPLSDQKCWAQ